MAAWKAVYLVVSSVELKVDMKVEKLGGRWELKRAVRKDSRTVDTMAESMVVRMEYRTVAQWAERKAGMTAERSVVSMDKKMDELMAVQ